MTSDTTAPGQDAAQARLHELVDVWHRTCQDVLALLEQLDEQDWSRPTDLPGWDVKAVAAHLAHLESELAGMPQEQVEVPESPHVRNVLGQYTEVGPAVRRAWPVERIVAELRTAVETRAQRLRDDPPTDLSETGPSFAALAGWSWETLLTNRPLDLWMHEQDIRRAVGRPGGLDSAGAVHVAGVFARALPMVVGKRAQAQPGQSVVLEVADAPAGVLPRIAVEVGADGRARPVEPPADPTATLRLPFEDWLRACGGRCGADEVAAALEGDQALGRRVLEGLAVTP
jgi:uncharacterized protein (TIGR03083 family)